MILNKKEKSSCQLVNNLETCKHAATNQLWKRKPLRKVSLSKKRLKRTGPKLEPSGTSQIIPDLSEKTTQETYFTSLKNNFFLN